MNTALEREFFLLAAIFLMGRYRLINAKTVLEGANFDDCGAFTGMVDAHYEMKEVLREMKEKNKWQRTP